MSNSSKLIKTFLTEIKNEGRSSPAGMHWDNFFNFLKKFKSPNEPDPPKPLILAASGESDTSIHNRLKRQLEWALEHHCLEEAIEFLKNISSENWNSGSIQN